MFWDSGCPIESDQKVIPIFKRSSWAFLPYLYQWSNTIAHPKWPTNEIANFHSNESTNNTNPPTITPSGIPMLSPALRGLPIRPPTHAPTITTMPLPGPTPCTGILVSWCWSSPILSYAQAPCDCSHTLYFYIHFLPIPLPILYAATIATKIELGDSIRGDTMTTNSWEYFWCGGISDQDLWFHVVGNGNVLTLLQQLGMTVPV
jgi:hypothetical protein